MKCEAVRGGEMRGKRGREGGRERRGGCERGRGGGGVVRGGEERGKRE